MLRLLLFLLLRKEVETMAIIYATLIVKGKKTYAQVPEKIEATGKAGSDRPGCEDRSRRNK